MSIKQRMTAGFVAVLLAAGGLSFSTITGLAFNCDYGYTNNQKSVSFQTGTYYANHWEGKCVAVFTGYYYGGSDDRYSWGGNWHPVSKMYTHQRAWDCHTGLQYDNSVALFNSAYVQLQTQIMCAYPVSADNNNEVYQAGVFDWWNYLKYP